MAGFIVLEDGRAYAVSNWAADAALRAIARSVDDDALRTWLLAQQSLIIGSGMTNVDLRELAPHIRPLMRLAIRDAYRQVSTDGAFEQLGAGDAYTAEWIRAFGELVEMLDRSEAGEPPDEFNPHMQGLIPDRGGRVGPGWEAQRESGFPV